MSFIRTIHSISVNTPYTPIAWPKQYYQGKRQLEANLARQRAMGQQTVAIPKPVVG